MNWLKLGVDFCVGVGYNYKHKGYTQNINKEIKMKIYICGQDRFNKVVLSYSKTNKEK